MESCQRKLDQPGNEKVTFDTFGSKENLRKTKNKKFDGLKHGINKNAKSERRW